MPLPTVKKGESKDDFVSRFMENESAKKEFPKNEQRQAVAFETYRSSKKKKQEKKESSYIKRPSLYGLKIKEGEESDVVEGIVATTHPDRVGDILSKDALVQIAECINNTDTAGDQNGSYRSVSLFHDWIHADDPTLDEAAFLKPTAQVVELDDGHFGVKVEAELNKYYRGDMPVDEIKYRIDNGQIAGFSIEYNTDEANSRDVQYNGSEFRFIDKLTEFGGVGLARARMIANPQAVIYKEIAKEQLKKEIKEAENMVENATEENKKPEEEKAEEKKEEEEKVEVEDKKEEEKKVEEKELDVKEILQSKEFKNAVNEVLEVKSKVIKQAKEAEVKMESKEVLCVKELKDAAVSGNSFSYKEAASRYFEMNNESISAQMSGAGIPLRSTMQFKCVNQTNGLLGKGKLIVSRNMETKDTLDTQTNTSTYTQNIVEFADVYLPTLIESFNNQTNLFGALPKRDHIEGGNKYGWRITTSQNTTLSVDPDDPTVVKNPASKVKLQTDIKEYRNGISVTDYVLHHSRASMGDLFMKEAQKAMDDMMKAINKDLFTEQADGDGTKVLGMEAIADAAGNTTLYGLTRSTTNRLAPTTATDTYEAMGTTVTLSSLRGKMQKVEVEGAMRSNMRLIMNPKQRDRIFDLEDTKIRYANDPNMGFYGAPAFDGVPMIVDSDCQVDAIFVTDFESQYIVVSRAPQLNGLAKVGAAEEAYVNIFLAHVYELPRRINMMDTLS